MKYKLTKEYPNSEKAGTIFTKDERGQYIKENPLVIIQEEEIKNYPEFWEEVKEKEYTILSFVNNSGDLFNMGSDGEYRVKTWSSNISLSLESCLDGTLKIHSVRRESDGEVFTLGDYVTDGAIKTQTLDKIEIYKNIFIVEAGVLGCKLDFIKKEAPVSKPILVTEDGVEILEGQQVWYLDSAWYYTSIQADVEKHEEIKSRCKFFSTENKLEEYIKWNKPMYSLNDVKSADKIATGVHGDLLDVLISLGRK